MIHQRDFVCDDSPAFCIFLCGSLCDRWLVAFAASFKGDSRDPQSWDPLMVIRASHYWGVPENPIESWFSPNKKNTCWKSDGSQKFRR